MAQSIVTTLSPDELADLLAPRLAVRLEEEWSRHARRRVRRGERMRTAPQREQSAAIDKPNDEGGRS
jgi:hypothetical protein